MKTFFAIIFVGLVSTAVAQVDTAKNIVHSTIRGTEEAADTVYHGAKSAVETVVGAVTPDTDARRVDVTVSGDRIDLPTPLKRGKTAFVVKNVGRTAQNFEVDGRGVHRRFAGALNPGETKVMHAYLKRGTYAVYSSGKNDNQAAAKATFRVR
jgi:hypothetical protein